MRVLDGRKVPARSHTRGIVQAAERPAASPIYVKGMGLGAQLASLVQVSYCSRQDYGQKAHWKY